MATETTEPAQASFPSLGLRLGPGGVSVWEIPDEEPGTLADIFDAEDSRRQNLVLYALRDARAFRRCAAAIGAAVDPYELILAVMSCINAHLRPPDRLADYRRRMRITAKSAHAAAEALQELSSSMDEIERAAWLWRLKDLGISTRQTHTSSPISATWRLASIACLLGGALKDRGGRSKMAAFERLLQDLARIFERATGRPPTITRNHPTSTASWSTSIAHS